MSGPLISRRHGFGNKLDEPILAAMAQDVQLHGVGVQLDCARLLVDLKKNKKIKREIICEKLTIVIPPPTAYHLRSCFLAPTGDQGFKVCRFVIDFMHLRD